MGKRITLITHAVNNSDENDAIPYPLIPNSLDKRTMIKIKEQYYPRKIG